MPSLTRSLVIPCYNEAANLPLLVPRCASLCDERTEVVLVDNGSTDDSAEVMRSLLRDHHGCRSVRVDENQGYGFGILSGLRAATGDILGWTHADMQTDPMDAVTGLARFDAASEPSRVFVKGRRFGRPLGDVVFTMGMALFETVLVRAPMWDINAQPTLFHRTFFEGWSDPPSDFSLDLYAYYQARKANCEIVRFPVRFGERAHGVSHWNVDWRSKAKFIKRTVDFSMELRRRL